jgi:hypothetical protein
MGLGTPYGVLALKNRPFLSPTFGNYGAATGGTSSSITVSSVNYTLLTFTSDSTLTVTKAGLFDVLLFGGAGGGGYWGTGGGGGGSGGITQQTVYLSANQTVDIGAGGASLGYPGFPSSIGSIPTAIMASGSGFNFIPTFYSDPTGGGVGGSSGGSAAVTGNIQGFGGGASNGGNSAGGGGGGATSAGADSGATTGGAGGAGYDVSAFIGGSVLYKGAGGGGAGSGGGGAGGSSVGGNGDGGAGGTSAAANSASGGGARGPGATGGNGGSGIIYVRFKV